MLAYWICLQLLQQIPQSYTFKKKMNSSKWLISFIAFLCFSLWNSFLPRTYFCYIYHQLTLFLPSATGGGCFHILGRCSSSIHPRQTCKAHLMSTGKFSGVSINILSWLCKNYLISCQLWAKLFQEFCFLAFLYLQPLAFQVLSCVNYLVVSWLLRARFLLCFSTERWLVVGLSCSKKSWRCIVYALFWKY